MALNFLSMILKKVMNNMRKNNDDNIDKSVYYLNKIYRNIQDYGLFITIKKTLFNLLKPFYYVNELTLFELNLRQDNIFDNKNPNFQTQDFQHRGQKHNKYRQPSNHFLILLHDQGLLPPPAPKLTGRLLLWTMIKLK